MSVCKNIPTEPKRSWPIGIIYCERKELTSAEKQFITYLKKAFEAYYHS